jgi:hypothetical protein
MKPPDSQEHIPPDPAAEVARQVEALASPHAGERREALRALARLGATAEPAIAALIAAFRDPVLELRERAVRILAGLGSAAVPALIEAVRGDDADVRKVAIVTLGRIGPAAAVAEDVLVKTLDDDWLAGTAREALQRIRGQQRSRRSPLHRLVPWLLAGWAVLALLALIGGVLSWATQAVFGFPVEAAVASASILGGMGATLGIVLGVSRGGVRALLLWPVLLGLAGLTAGFLLGGLVGGAIEPVREALSR